jgi:hypothetical protein
MVAALKADIIAIGTSKHVVATMRCHRTEVEIAGLNEACVIAQHERASEAEKREEGFGCPRMGLGRRRE